MTPFDILIAVLLGGLLGIVGQIIRAVTGLKKMLEKGSMDDFRFPILLVSLLIGFGTGVLAILVTGYIDGGVPVDSKLLLAIIASGYAGTDAIESFMKNSIPKS